MLTRAVVPLMAMVAVTLIAAQLASPAVAQSLEDALRRAEQPPGGSSPPPSSGSGGGSSGTSGARRWGALAAGLWKRRGVVQVAVGTAIRYATEGEARSAALRQCRGAGGNNCKIASTWSRGCGYITTGRNRKGAGWVARATYEKTMSDCRRKGYRCKKAIGGCVD